jgi:hypothetical protein
MEVWFDCVCPAIGTSLYFAFSSWRAALAQKREQDLLLASEAARLIGEQVPAGAKAVTGTFKTEQPATPVLKGRPRD